MTWPRHFLEVDDLAPAELTAVLDASEKGIPGPLLAGKGVGLIFEKPSLRTRNSCEMAVVQLGGHPVTMTDGEVGLGKRESVQDVTRVLAGYHCLLAARVFAHAKIEAMAAVSPVPVVNLLSDDAHPCQTLADLLTLRRHFGSLAGLTIAWIGDFTNVARSLALGAMLTGTHVRVASPAGYGPSGADLDHARMRSVGGATLTVCERAEDAVAGADAVSTDSWVSMGLEAQADLRRRVFESYRVDRRLFGLAGRDAVFLHCLPAHRGDEVSDDVMDGPRSLVFPQAHNRMHTFRGLLVWLASVGPLG